LQPDSKNVQPDFTPWLATKFFVPLALQGASQSLTYPLVATVVTRGGRGVLDLAAFAQGQAVMFLIAAMAGGILTTGMVFGRDTAGFLQYQRLINRMATGLLLLQLLACVPPFDGLIFRDLLGLAPEMQTIARNVLLLCSPLQVLFIMRSPGLAVLYNARASGSANMATLSRIIVTALIARFFVSFGWVGYKVGVLALTGPVVLELFLIRRLARPYIARLPFREEAEAGLKTQFAFTLPLSFGGVLLSAASFMVGAFIMRATEAERMLAIHYVTMGLVSPISVAAMRMQAVSLAFPPQYERDNRTLWFSLWAGCGLAGIVLLVQYPPVALWYFNKIQNLPLTDIPLAMRAMLLMTLLPISQSLRGHAEGLAAWHRRPNAILAGQAVNLATLVSTLFISLQFAMPGYMMGVTAILVAAIMTLVTIRLGLFWAELEETFGRPPRNVRPTEGQ